MFSSFVALISSIIALTIPFIMREVVKRDMEEKLKKHFHVSTTSIDKKNKKP